MITLKQTAIKAISKMPDTAKIDEIMYKSYVKVVNDIVDRSDYLASFPNLERKTEEIDDDNLRKIIVYSYKMMHFPATHYLSLTASNGNIGGLLFELC